MGAWVHEWGDPPRSTSCATGSHNSGRKVGGVAQGKNSPAAIGCFRARGWFDERLNVASAPVSGFLWNVSSLLRVRDFRSKRIPRTRVVVDRELAWAMRSKCGVKFKARRAPGNKRSREDSPDAERSRMVSP